MIKVAERRIESICVYCSSSDAVDETYRSAAVELGKTTAMQGLNLVYGGARVGLMGLLARTAKEHGAHVVGIIPNSIRQLAFHGCDELITAKDLRERKSLMEAKSDAFVSLPGGFGTLEETIEVLTLKQLNAHQKPVVFLNINGFYDHLIELFELFYRESFAKESFRCLYRICTGVGEVFDYLSSYEPQAPIRKWF
jgi:uncharacterized protein (TIGR00730 family)